MDYFSITQISEKWGIKQRRIRVVCSEGRIPGAYKVGTYWLIPEDAAKPKVDYLDQNFKPQHGKCSGWTAQIIQHELDHVAEIGVFSFVKKSIRQPR